MYMPALSNKYILIVNILFFLKIVFYRVNVILYVIKTKDFKFSRYRNNRMEYLYIYIYTSGSNELIIFNFYNR